VGLFNNYKKVGLHKTLRDQNLPLFRRFIGSQIFKARVSKESKQRLFFSSSWT